MTNTDSGGRPVRSGPSETAELLIDVTRAAEILGISRTTVHQMIVNGDLRAFHLEPGRRQVGAKRYLSEIDVQKLARKLRAEQ